LRLAIAWVVVGALLAFTVLGAVSAQKIPEVASWVVASVALAAGMGAMIMSAEPVRRREARGPLLAVLRPMLSVATGAVTLLSTMVAGCNDEGGVPSWERCQTWLGTPTVDWPGASLLALALSLGVGHLVWRLFGRLFPDRVE
jgi:peptidoglycan/LPS O-acetylase OafA/YrhL